VGGSGAVSSHVGATIPPVPAAASSSAAAAASVGTLNNSTNNIIGNISGQEFGTDHNNNVNNAPLDYDMVVQPRPDVVMDNNNNVINNIHDGASEESSNNMNMVVGVDIGEGVDISQRHNEGEVQQEQHQQQPQQQAVDEIYPPRLPLPPHQHQQQQHQQLHQQQQLQQQQMMPLQLQHLPLPPIHPQAHYNNHLQPQGQFHLHHHHQPLIHLPHHGFVPGDTSVLVTGNPPPGRNGHSATLATDPDDEDNGRIIIIGGWLGTGPLAASDMHVLDISNGGQQLRWYQPAVKGTPPGPCNMHSADYVSKQREVYVFRGGNGREYLNDLHALSTTTLVWRKVETTGQIPQQRANHSSAILDETGELFIFGGWYVVLLWEQNTPTDRQACIVFVVIVVAADRGQHI
jgi:hypothetical protein